MSTQSLQQASWRVLLSLICSTLWVNGVDERCAVLLSSTGVQENCTGDAAEHLVRWIVADGTCTPMNVLNCSSSFASSLSSQEECIMACGKTRCMNCILCLQERGGQDPSCMVADIPDLQNLATSCNDLFFIQDLWLAGP